MVISLFVVQFGNFERIFKEELRFWQQPKRVTIQEITEKVHNVVMKMI